MQDKLVEGAFSIFLRALNLSHATSAPLVGSCLSDFYVLATEVVNLPLYQNGLEWASLKFTGNKVAGGRNIGCYLHKNTRSLNVSESDNHLRSINDLGFH